ncbi:phage terminase large subunit-like protein [Aneurinibacillus soli]|uniref:Phage Terminase n=1 Tax=Aneurinibacillus soli TaxID=1500254 RepID=A0A0U4WKG2_9BACL|nr:terminase TerL endonuclease subunit [Aneurinibacillus soli]PYE62973.1 phage terminase large subunit-like protein [Aneurinibacillus soli]BAU28968.1 Phage Terminase [Aneurinibacillus soli]
MLKEWLIDYSYDVLNGAIVACQKHKWACERFLRDIEREGSDDFPYIFDEEKAWRFLKWMTLFKHTKGKLQGQDIQPDFIQIFVFGNIYGWVQQKNRYRRFKKSYWQVGRKNAKSQSLACVSSYESMALGENMSEVYIGATKTEQSKIVWKETAAQIKGCRFLKGKYKIAYGKIEHLKSGSFIEALSKDANKSGDGFNPQCGIIDEYHAHKTSEIYDVLDSGMGARVQPLMMVITTAGFELQNPCYSVEYLYVSKILDPDNPIENEEYFVMINELEKDDDIKDENNWAKANPILCSYEEGVSYLRGQLKAALDVPEKMRNFLTKNMNIWVDQKENGYMPMNKWNECGKEPMPDLQGREGYGGIDLSKTIDLTSVSFEFPLDDGRIAVLSHSFMPEDTIAAKRQTDKVPYDLWVKQGWITATPGAVVDYKFIAAYIKEQIQQNKWKLKEIGFDPYNATHFAQEMQMDGYEMLEIRQGVKTLSEPTKKFRELVLQNKIVHNNNPVLSWAISNAVTKQDAQENIMLDKDKSTDRIDPIASLITAHVRVMRIGFENRPSIYEKQDIRTI